jgi:hypothetical protein
MAGERGSQGKLSQIDPASDEDTPIDGAAPGSE